MMRNVVCPIRGTSGHKPKMKKNKKKTELLPVFCEEERRIIICFHIEWFTKAPYMIRCKKKQHMIKV